MKVDVLQVYVSTAAIFGIGVFWFNFNKKVFYTVCDLIKAPFIGTDSPVEPGYERYPAEEPGYENDSDSELNSEVAHWVSES